MFVFARKRKKSKTKTKKSMPPNSIDSGLSFKQAAFQDLTHPEKRKREKENKENNQVTRK